MKTNLTIIVAASLLSLTPVQASETGWYVGAGYGKAKLVYNTKKALDKSIDKSVSTQTNNLNNAVSAYVDKVNVKLNECGEGCSSISPLHIETSSVPSTVVLKNAITLNESYDQNQYNFYIGYKFSNRFGVEVGQQHYTFQARAALPVNMSFARSGTVEDQSGMIDATGNITALATADMTVTTLVMTYDLIKTTHTDTFLKLGAGYGNAKLTSNEQYDYRYTYNTCINAKCYSGHNSATVGNTSSSSSYSGYLPVYGIGTNYNLTKTSTIRVEGVRLGVGSTRVDTVTVGVLFRL